MGTPLTPLQKVSKNIQSLQDDLRYGQEKFQREASMPSPRRHGLH
jgi:hypothetical protein